MYNTAKATISEIKIHNQEVGGHWFDKSTMEFFQTKIEGDACCGTGGIYFVTSEQFLSEGYKNDRMYTVREYEPISGNIKTAGEFYEIEERREARKTARQLANGTYEMNHPTGL